MQLLVLNDRELAWVNSQGRRTVEPGAALVENDHAVYGDAALARARLAPRGFQDQHWQLLNSDSLAVTAPGVQNNADLVFRHLQQLAAASGYSAANDGTVATEQVICAVPGNVNNEQLGLLLGIAQEAKINIGSFVDSALLYSLDQSLPAEAWCIDVANRRGVLTRLARDENGLRSVEATDLQQLSISGLIDSWLDLLTDQFVARSRFDPLRVAETEQQLFDQVRQWLRRGGPLNAGVEHQGSQRAVDLSEEEMSGRAQQRYREANNRLPARASVVLTPIAATLPGFAQYLTGHGHTVQTSTQDALWSNATQSPELTNPAAVHFVQALASTSSEAVAPVRHQHATHALTNNVAIPLNKLAQELATLAGSPRNGFQVTEASAAVLVNGAAEATQSALAAGDRLKVNDTEYLCIRVEANE